MAIKSIDDGSVMPTEKAAELHNGLVSGEIKFEFAPGVLEQMETLGISLDDLRRMLIEGAKETMT